MEQQIMINGIRIDRINEGDAKGSQFIGMLKHKTYKDLVEALGQPAKIDDGKTRIQWLVKAEGTILCIYDYKDGNIDVGALKEWHIGSNKTGSEIGDLIDRLFFNKIP